MQVVWVIIDTYVYQVVWVIIDKYVYASCMGNHRYICISRRDGQFLYQY